jgi:hypothetical protein
VIRVINKDGTYGVEYSDGDKAFYVDESAIRNASSGADAAAEEKTGSSSRASGMQSSTLSYDDTPVRGSNMQSLLNDIQLL